MVLVSYVVFHTNMNIPENTDTYDNTSRLSVVDAINPVTSAVIASDYAKKISSAYAFNPTYGSDSGQASQVLYADGMAYQNQELLHNADASVIAEQTDSALALPAYTVPWLDSDFKAYMPYDSITDTTTPQWHYRKHAWTDYNGLRRVGDDYLVAMGTYYTDEVGNRFKITLDSGSQITVTVGDIKDPAHTDRYNMYTPVKNHSGKIIGANVLEFLVDTDKLNEKAAKLGTVSCIDGLEGNVESIEKLT
jgi:hypothetical protein